MSSDIKVSVCVVTYNQEKYIAECLQSLVDQETDFPFEIIVGEDCSTDRTRDIVEEFALKYPDLIVRNYQDKNVGPTKNVFSTYALARGKYIAHMDGDDFALPGKLTKQCQYLDENPECNIVWSRMKIMDHSTSRLYDDLLKNDHILNKKYTQADLLQLGSIACHSSKMFRKETLNFISLPEHEVYDFYIDVSQIGSGYGKIMPCFLGVYRSGVGISSRNGISEVYIDNVEALVDNYSCMRPLLSARAFVLFLVQLKKKKINSRLFKIFLFNFSIKTFLAFANIYRFYRFYRFFRSPI